MSVCVYGHHTYDSYNTVGLLALWPTIDECEGVIHLLYILKFVGTSYNYGSRYLY